MLYLFNRHSARYPDLDDVEKMQSILYRVRDLTMEAAAEGIALRVTTDHFSLHFKLRTELRVSSH